MTGEEIVRGYYDALDRHAYERLRALLAPEFVHERPDVTLEGRERFVTFMRDERPETATSHPIEAIYAAESCGDGPGEEYAARGRLVADDGDLLTGFVDVFTLEDGQIVELRTYTD